MSIIISQSNASGTSRVRPVIEAARSMCPTKGAAVNTRSQVTARRAGQALFDPRRRPHTDTVPGGRAPSRSASPDRAGPGPPRSAAAAAPGSHPARSSDPRRPTRRTPRPPEIGNGATHRTGRRRRRRTGHRNGGPPARARTGRTARATYASCSDGGSLPRQLHRVSRADAFGDCLQFDGGESNTQWLEGIFSRSGGSVGWAVLVGNGPTRPAQPGRNHGAAP